MNIPSSQYLKWLLAHPVYLLLFLMILLMPPVHGQNMDGNLRISTFDMDVTPPVDRDFLTYNKQIET